MSHPKLSAVPADMVLVSTHGVGAGSLPLMIYTRRGSYGASVGFPKAEPVGVEIDAIIEAARIDLGKCYSRSGTPTRAGGRNSVKFFA